MIYRPTDPSGINHRQSSRPRSVIPTICATKCSVRRGTTTLEMAFAIPVFFLLVFGIVELSRGYMVSHLLSNAARDGCRVGIIDGATTSEVQSTVNDALASQGIKNATTVVKVNGVEKEAATATMNDRITVHVSVAVEDFTWIPGMSFFEGSLAGQYTLVHE